MATTTTLGKLKVTLGADTKQLEQSKRRAEKLLSDLDKRMQRVQRIATRMAGALATALAGRALVNLGQQAINTAEKIGQLAQQVGVSVEQFSALSYAAEQNGMSVEELGRAFRNVARNMQAAAQGPTDFSRALDALNIAWRDAHGNFRKADDLLVDVAEQFAQMEDSAGKTALAMKILGEEVGPKLIPLLNQGRDGIKELKEEARRLGLVIDADTVESATRFNAVLTRLNKVFQGVIALTMSKLLPAFSALADRIQTMASEGLNMQKVADNLAFAFKGVATAALAAAGGIATLVEFGRQFWNMFKLEFGDVNKTVGEEFQELVDHFRSVISPLSATADLLKTLWSDQRKEIEATGIALEEHQKLQAPVIESTKALAQAQSEYNQLLSEGQRIMHDLQSPYERMIAVQERLNQIFRAAAIDAKTLGLAMQQSTMAAAGAYAGLASRVGNALSQMFQKNKAVAIASAVANTAEAVTKTLATYGGTPWGWAQAAATAAAGAAQIASIRRATPSGSGSAPRVGGGGFSGGRTSSSSSTSTGAVLTIQTIGRGDFITREVFEDLMERIVQWQRDGGMIAPLRT